MIKLSKNDNQGYYKLNERVGQLMILPYPQIEFEEVDQLSDTARGNGGFGEEKEGDLYQTSPSHSH